MNSSSSIAIDVAIMGAGVAGLWLANLLQNKGYQVAVFDTQGIGGTQTLASQGMIHGGMKYTLTGAFTQASEAIADMPRHWRACLCSEGEVDLKHTRILSDHFYLWSTASVTSKLATFLASKVTRGRVSPVKDSARPPLMRHDAFTGHLYKLDDIVIDTKSLVANLAHNLALPVFHLPQDYRLHRDNGIPTLTVNGLEIRANRLLLCAGQDNADLLTQLGLDAPAMQIRPLQQVMVKQAFPFEFFGHCLGASSTPRLTISSHKLPHGESLWYLGGQLAEQGAQASPEALIEQAKEELNALIPWLDLTDASWATLKVNRAERAQPNGARPDQAAFEPTAHADVFAVWPTKLTLTPNVGSQMLAAFEHTPPFSPAQSIDELRATLAQALPFAELIKQPWELAFPPEEPEEERLTRLLLNDLDDE